MSTRKEFDWEFFNEDGDLVKAIKVVYYFDKEECPACKGSGKQPYDNRTPIDFSDINYGPVKTREPEPLEEECYLCHGDGDREKIDYKSMTEKQTKIYKDYLKSIDKDKEEYENYLLNLKIEEGN